MLPQYTFALGGTDAIKQFMTFLEDFRQTEKVITRKRANTNAYKGIE